MNVLVINAGSSSLKYQLLNPETGVLLAKGLCERIGLDGRFTYKPQLPGRAVRDAEKLAMPTHAEAISEVLRALARQTALGLQLARGRLAEQIESDEPDPDVEATVARSVA